MPNDFDYLADLPKADLMRVTIALAMETYALADRLQGLEEILAAKGIDLGALDAPTDPAAFDDARRARRDAFAERVLHPLLP
ncbi:hypothetical protein ACQW02_26100 [Humitalea sp. 24SJ18S-53]|uniref:hypothetical protein n=1 Tax=Humitalea sp. 24SJ18S-53 TaxID=3422307 RepID=UPI003D668E85